MDALDLGDGGVTRLEEDRVRTIERAERLQAVMHADEPPRFERMVRTVHVRREARVPYEPGAVGLQRSSVSMSSRHSPGDMPVDSRSTGSPFNSRFTTARPLAESSYAPIR